jgi:hypothetical protein
MESDYSDLIKSAIKFMIKDLYLLMTATFLYAPQENSVLITRSGICKGEVTKRRYY